jgi:hypothetical protein
MKAFTHTHVRFASAINRKIYFESAFSQKLQYCIYKKENFWGKKRNEFFFRIVATQQST